MHKSLQCEKKKKTTHSLHQSILPTSFFLILVHIPIHQIITESASKTSKTFNTQGREETKYYKKEQ